jgi:hypothetical protein
VEVMEVKRGEGAVRGPSECWEEKEQTDSAAKTRRSPISVWVLERSMARVVEVADIWL